MRALRGSFESMQVSLCPGGGIGRRTRFRFWRREAWKFESSPGHQFDTRLGTVGTVPGFHPEIVEAN